MDDAMKRTPGPWSPLLVLLVASPVWAAGDQDLPDPTKPAAVFEAQVAKPAAAGEASTAPLLQSVILRKNGKPGAVINGQLVELGQEIGGARLTRVTETEVTLVSESGKETLKLNPAVEKRPAPVKRDAQPMAKRKTTSRKDAR